MGGKEATDVQERAAGLIYHKPIGAPRTVAEVAGLASTTGLAERDVVHGLATAEPRSSTSFPGRFTTAGKKEHGTAQAASPIRIGYV
jgi:hypothetical protein